VEETSWKSYFISAWTLVSMISAIKAITPISMFSRVHFGDRLFGLWVE